MPSPTKGAALRDRFGRFVGASTAPKPPPVRRPVLRNAQGRFVSTLPPLQRGDQLEFVRRGLRERGEVARQRALQVQLAPGDPIRKALA